MVALFLLYDDVSDALTCHLMLNNCNLPILKRITLIPIEIIIRWRMHMTPLILGIVISTSVYQSDKISLIVADCLIVMFITEFDNIIFSYFIKE